MAIDDSGDWWTGTDPADIEEYLSEYSQTEADYPTTDYRQIVCPCGAIEFSLTRASTTTKRICKACQKVAYICRTEDDWNEASELEGAEQYECIECSSPIANVMVGFAGYDEDELSDAVRWFYVGVRCTNCGILGCYNDGKVGRGPASEVYNTV